MSFENSQLECGLYKNLPQFDQNSGNNSTFISNSDLDAANLKKKKLASQERVVGNTCLIAMGILISLVGMMFAFLSFICIFHRCQVSKLSIVSTAPLGSVLTISQVTSHIAPLCVPITMRLFSYLLSDQWLKSSLNEGPNRPSPMQYVWILDYSLPF
jgi:hypothetical protein